MSDKEQITQPTSGSNDVGTETDDNHLHTDVSSGSDTQLHLAAKSGKKNNKNTNSQKQSISNNKNKFLTADETEE